MDFQKAKLSNPFNSKNQPPPKDESHDSAQVFPDLFLSRPEKPLFSGSELREALLLLYSKTRAGTLEGAMELVWHKSLGKPEKANVERIITVLRLSMDGRIKPPFDLHKAYSRLTSLQEPGVPGPGR